MKKLSYMTLCSMVLLSGVVGHAQTVEEAPSVSTVDEAAEESIPVYTTDPNSIEYTTTIPDVGVTETVKESETENETTVPQNQQHSSVEKTEDRVPVEHKEIETSSEPADSITSQDVTVEDMKKNEGITESVLVGTDVTQTTSVNTSLPNTVDSQVQQTQKVSDLVLPRTGQKVEGMLQGFMLVLLSIGGIFFKNRFGMKKQ